MGERPISNCIRPRGNGQPPFARAILFSIAAGAVSVVSGASSAQDDGVAVWGKGNCSFCHGGIAQGGQGGEQPAGPSLRRTSLTRDQIVEVVSCGRPGTPMPYNLVGAYTEVPCYELNEPPERSFQGASLNQEEIEALADFLIEHVVGVTEITRQDCAVFYRGNVESPACVRYPE